MATNVYERYLMRKAALNNAEANQTKISEQNTAPEAEPNIPVFSKETVQPEAQDTEPAVDEAPAQDPVRKNHKKSHPAS